MQSQMKVRLLALGAVMSTLASSGVVAHNLSATRSVEPIVAEAETTQVVAVQSEAVIERSAEATQGASIAAPTQGGLPLSFLFPWLGALFEALGI